MGLLALLGLELASICSTYSVFFGGSIFSYRFLPKGDCRLCCPIQRDADITFNLFTRKNPTIPQQLFVDDLWSIESSYLDPSLPTTFYVHGFTERAMGMSARTVKDAYLKRGTHNIIMVDWGSLCGFPYYAAAVKNTRVVGKYLAEFIKFLHNAGIVPVESIHVIGFSLGAEVSGFAGKALGPGVLPRITGLDPAFPLYIYQGDRGHLAPSDAQFVDIIHTDGGVFGFPNPIGHADFYPNGGVALQPGCRLSQLARRGHAEEVVACSHNRAWMYYAESVNKEYAFPALFCPSYEDYEQGYCNQSVADSARPSAFMGYAADVRKWIAGAKTLTRFFHQKKKICADIYGASKVDKVTVCGAANSLGQTLALLLKQTDLIRELHLYDHVNVRGIALDLDHIDTSVRVRPNSGESAMRDALRNADIVVFTYGFDNGVTSSEDQCLQMNGPILHDCAIKVASICPEAFICILSPPVNSLVPLFSEVMKGCNVYDPNRIFGLCSLPEMRYNTLVSDYLNLDPALMNVPLIGGVSPSTSVPLFSHTQPFNEFSEEDIRLILSNIYDIPKECKKLHTAAPLSTAYATLRFILTLAAGITNCDYAKQTAFVRSDVMSQVKYFASFLKFGAKGAVVNYGLPKLSDSEMQMLEKALPQLEQDIEKGINMYKLLSHEESKEDLLLKSMAEKPFITKMPCPPCPCLPTEVCATKPKPHPCAPANPCTVCCTYPCCCFPRCNKHEKL